MKALPPPSERTFAARIAAGTIAAGTLSLLALAWRGARDGSGPWAPINAVSHWIWPRRALMHHGKSARFGIPGLLIHFSSTALWAGIFSLFRRPRHGEAPMESVARASAVAGLAAVVDLAVVPARLTPGFEHKLTARSLVLVYCAFAIGLLASELIDEGASGTQLSRRRRK
ncbi:MAG TPA: hypothetical protein PKA20_05115 [Burkholderiaceae bacterium]|nr:hypothetical protein [Burkholderiaceae bacterium]